jgi:hypothetical protein
LIVSTGRYDDSRLPDLRAPGLDAADLSAVLGDPGVGGFDVTALLDREEHRLRLAVDEFLGGRDPAETVLVYLSCHGIRTKWGELYFAASDTDLDRVSATALEARWLTDRLNECRAGRQIVILDSCFSGAFIGAKGTGVTSLENWVHDTAADGRGRVVLTASRATEYSFEGSAPSTGEPARSVFSAALIDGLRTGKADEDGDGLVSAFEAHAYTRRRVRDTGGTQTPQILFRGEGTIYLARSPAGMAVEPAPLPESLRSALDNPLPAVRAAAVGTLARWLEGTDAAKVITARTTLEEVAAQDNAHVSGVARGHLDRFGTHPAGAGPDHAAEAPATAPDAAPAPGTGRISRRWRLARPGKNLRRRAVKGLAAFGIVAVAGIIIAVSTMLALSRHDQPLSCRASRQAGLHKVTMPGGTTGGQLVICPVNVRISQRPAPSLSLSGQIIGRLPANQLLAIVSQPDPGSCSPEGSPGSGGYYLLKTLSMATSENNNWALQTGVSYNGSQLIQRHFYFLLGTQSAINSFSQDKANYEAAHDGDSGFYKGKPDITGFKLLGQFTFTPVEPANHYCKT